jgi:hypothetical protein
LVIANVDEWAGEGQLNQWNNIQNQLQTTVSLLE